VKGWTEIDGIPKREWLEHCSKVRAAMRMNKVSIFGLCRLAVIPCECGYCVRHGRIARIEFETENGDLLCRDGAVLWAVHARWGKKTSKEDL